MSDNYLEQLGVFYNEKMKFLTRKKKFTHCDQCSNPKVFQETETELLFTCGSTTGDCGTQIRIKFPLYIHYETQIKELEDRMKTQLNWKVLQDYIDCEKENSAQEKETKLIKETLFYISEEFKKQNIIQKQESLQRFYTNRINKTKRCSILQKQLKNESLTIEDRQSIQKEYASHVIEMNEEYEITHKLVYDMNPYLEQSPPKITIENTHFQKDTKKQTKQIKQTKPEESQLINRIIQHFKENQGIMTKKDYNKEVKKPHKTLWGGRLFAALQQGDKSWMAEEQNDIGSMIIKPSVSSPSEIQLTKEWIVFLKIQEDELPESEPQTEEEEEEEESESVITKPTMNDIKEGLKIVWRHKGTEEDVHGYLDKVDKRFKTKVKIITNNNEKVTVPLSEIVKIIL